MKKFIAFILIIATAVCLYGCNDSISATEISEHIPHSKVVGKEQDVDFTEASMNVYLELFKGCAAESKNKNLLISPLSIQLALAMTANGADGETKAEMEKVLGDIPTEDLNEYLYTYITSLPTNENYKLHIANSIWYREDGMEVYEDFISTNKSYYDAQLYKAPFDTSTVKDINRWIKDNTDSMIDKIVDDIDIDTVMYLINALAFDAKWDTVFNKEDVYDGTFTNISGDKKTVSMMNGAVGQYISLDGADGFIKNYKDCKYSFAAILPKEGTDIYDFIARLESRELAKALTDFESTSVGIALPKFTYEYELSMNGVLSAMGMPSAFADDANFSKMGYSPMGNLFIGDVLHKTYISVDELGTKAGAVTKVEMKAESMPVYEHTVYLDRPFVYFIIDNSANLPIFMGCVTDIEK